MFKRTMNQSLHKYAPVSKRLEVIDDTIMDALLSSPHTREGVFGFEVECDGREKEYSFFSPPFFRTEIGEGYDRYCKHLLNDIDSLHCYQIALSRPSFLPLYTEEPFSLIDQITSLATEGNPLFLQILFTKKHDDYKQIFVNQYIEFLQGNDNPSRSRVGQRIQKKVLNVLNKVSGYETERQEVEDIEYKIMDSAYRFEIRLMLHQQDTEGFEEEARKILDELNYYNQLHLFEVKRKKEKMKFIERFIEQEYWKESKDQVISEAELLVLATGSVEEKKEELRTIAEKIEVVKEETKKEIIKMPHFQSLVSLLPANKAPVDRQIDLKYQKELPKALRKVKVVKDQAINIVDIALGAVMQRVTIEIPDDVVFTDIRKKYEDIAAVLGEKSLSVIPGDMPNTVTFLIPCAKREVVYLRRVLEDPEFIRFAKENPLPFACGVDVFDKLVLKCLTQAPHLLIAGATNSGKSVFLTATLITLMLLKKPDELRFYLIDPKLVELNHFEGFAHVEDLILDMPKAAKTLTKVAEEMEMRYRAFSEIGVKTLPDYNDKSKTKMPYIICVVEEYYDLKMAMPAVDDPIKRLTQKGRGAGIHMIIATQRPDAKVMEGVIKANIPSKVSFKLETSNDYRTVFGTGIPFDNLLGFGDGVIKFVGQTQEFIRFQAPAITLDRKEHDDMVERIKGAFFGESIPAPVIEDLPEEVIEPEEELIDKLKRIIAQTGETRTEQLRKELGVRINIVSGLLKELEDEGWLKKEGKKRIVAASEEELSQWRKEQGDSVAISDEELED